MRLCPGARRICAAFDWSYQLLNPNDQTVFRRIAIFVGGFTLEAARAVAADADESPRDIADSLASLVMKSLVTADLGDGAARFRLLDTTRAYALAKLADNGEADALARRHAAYYRGVADTGLSRCRYHEHWINPSFLSDSRGRNCQCSKAPARIAKPLDIV